ncbi:phage tail tape measure protein [Alcaligenaceae bacterium]|nr:phage tail tape measure protein [Alcaligenaceae bacterium]
MIRSSIDTMDATSKLSQSIGTTVESISALTYAADMSGVSQDALAGSLVRLTKGMDDTIRGTGDAKKAFDELGIKVANTDGTLRDNVSVLNDVADKFSGMTDGAKKTALAVQLFGRSGAQLIPFLNSGRDGIKEMTDEAESLGIVLNTKTSKAAEDFNDNLSRIKKASDGFVIQATNDLLPTLSSITKGFVDAARASKSYWVSLLASTESVVFGDSKDALAEQQRLIKQIEDYNKAIVPDAEGGVNNAILKKGLAYAEARLAIVREQISRELGGMFPDNVPELPSIKITPEGGGNGGGRKPTARPEKPTDPLGDFIKEQEQATQSYLSFMNDITGETERRRVEQQQRYLDDALGLGRISADQYAKYMDEIAIKNKETLTAMDEFTVQAARNIESALGSGLYDLLDGNFKNMGDAFADMLKRMAADLAASELSKLLLGDYGSGKGIGGLLGGLFSVVKTGLAVGAANSSMDPIGSLIGSLGGRAGGGPVLGGGMYDVNERGIPELLTVGGRQMLMMGRQPGHVTPLLPADRGSAPARNSAPNITINNNAGGIDIEARMSDGQIIMEINKQIASQTPRIMAREQGNQNSTFSVAQRNAINVTPRR